MIVDSSAIVAIMADEVDADHYSAKLGESAVANISASNYI